MRTSPALHAAASIASVAFCSASGIVAAAPKLGWYATLARPSFSPPDWVFGSAWVILQLLMARAFYRVLRQPDYVPDRRGAIRLYLLQVVLNAGWAWAFFAARSPALGLGVIAALVTVMPALAWRFFALDRRAGALVLPSLLGAAFTAALNLSVLILNA